MNELLRSDDPRLLEAVQEYISNGLKGKENTSKPDWTSLHWFAASKEADPIRAQAWVAAGGDPNAQTDNGDTPLHISAWRGATAKSIFLMRLGCSPNIPNHRDNTPFHQALRKGFGSLALEMAHAEGDWGMQDKEGMSGLSHAIDFLKRRIRDLPGAESMFPETSPEAGLIGIMTRQPRELWDRPFSLRSPYLRVRSALENEPALSALSAQILAFRMDESLPEESLVIPRRPASRF